MEKLSVLLRKGRERAKFSRFTYMAREDGELYSDDLGALFLGAGGNPDDGLEDDFDYAGYNGIYHDQKPKNTSSAAIALVEKATGIPMQTLYKTLGLTSNGVFEDDWTLFDWFEDRNMSNYSTTDNIEELEGSDL